MPSNGSDGLERILDGDGVGDNSDAFPWDANESVDSDGDGYGDNSDAFDGCIGVERLRQRRNRRQRRYRCAGDGDGVDDDSDDSDGDGVCDADDAFHSIRVSSTTQTETG